LSNIKEISCHYHEIKQELWKQFSSGLMGLITSNQI